MLKKILPVIIITVCLLFAGCKAPADQEQKNNTETAVLSTETQEEDWKQVHSTQRDLEKLPQKIQKIFPPPAVRAYLHGAERFPLH